MSQRKLNHLTDLRHLLTAATNVIVADLIEIVLLLLALNRLTLAMDDGILSDDAVLWGIHLDHLELYLSHTTADNEKITLSDGSVSFSEVWGQEDVEERASDALNSICDG